MTEPEKWCTACKSRHPRSEFGADVTRGDGLRAQCRTSRHVPRRSSASRFAEKLAEDSSGCILWQGATYPSGYGAAWLDGRVQPANRVAWLLAVGEIPQGLYVLHRCDVRPCVNVAHLFLGDHADNMADMDAKGRRATFPGELNPRAKLTAEQVADIRQRARGGEAKRALARAFGVTPTAIRKIVAEKTWVREFPEAVTS